MLYRENNRCLFSDPHKTHTLCEQNVELYIKTQSVPRSKHTLYLGYTNQSVNAEYGKNRCLFSDPHKTHKYTV